VQATRDLLRQLATGNVDQRAVIYADLTGDLKEEAVVPITSGGSLGNIAYVVFRLDSGAPTPILTRTVDRTTPSGIKMSVEDGTLMETAGVYGNEDPLCCPSELRKTTFHWDGSRLQVEREVKEKQPSAKQ
jgi:hypothetical protein